MASKDKEPDTKRTWNDALRQENCVQVRKLLWEPDGNIRPGELRLGAVELLKEGWKEVDVAQQSLRSKPQRVWKGRTALHVAARRGDVELVKDILEVAYPLTPGASMASKDQDRKDVEFPISGAFMASKEQGRNSSDLLLSELLASIERLTDVFKTTLGASVDSKEKVGPGSSVDLNHLLEVIDYRYGLDALGMAVVNGNRQIVYLLKKASLHCGWNPYDISDDGSDDGSEDSKGSDTNYRCEVLAKALSAVTREVLEQMRENADNAENIIVLKQMYKDNCDFNFIDIEADMHLFFHFTFSTITSSRRKIESLIEKIQKEIIYRAVQYKNPLPEPLLNYLLVTLEDGQGRTALHVAVDSGKVRMFLTAIDSKLGTGDDTKVYLNVRDSANRTPLYRAAAKKLSYAVEDLLDDKRTDIHAKIVYDAHKWGKGLNIDKLSWKNGFRSDCVYVPEEKLTRKGFNNPNRMGSQAGPRPLWETSEFQVGPAPLCKTSSTALHVAIIHKHEGIVKEILQAISTLIDGHSGSSCRTSCRRLFTWPILPAWQGDDTAYQQFTVQTMQLAVLVGNIPILQQLLQAEERWKMPGYFSDGSMGESIAQSFFLAAAMGNPGMIKAFLDSKKGKFDCIKVRDSFGNTAMHHVLGGKHVQFHPHMVDFVGCRHVDLSRNYNYDWLSHWLANPQEQPQVQGGTEKDNLVDLDGRYVQRRGSINLLLEAGIDVSAQNFNHRTGSPDPDAPKDFVQWWYEKVANLTKEEQRHQNDAANAISVVAALVATASYVGPVTPPLGYDENSLQVNVLAVRIFVICNSLSFYFSLTAIMVALLPSLPLQNESLFREVERARLFVAFAGGSLYYSIIFVLVAFAAGYIAAIPDHGLSHHGLIIATTAVGGVYCLLVIFMLQKRFLKVFGATLLGRSKTDNYEGTRVARWLGQMIDREEIIEKIRRKFGITVVS